MNRELLINTAVYASIASAHANRVAQMSAEFVQSKSEAWAESPSEFIRQFRFLHSLTQRALAEKLSCSKRAVEEWESGNKKPPHYLFMALRELGRNLSRRA